MNRVIPQIFPENVTMVTNYSITSSLSTCTFAGFTGYVSKPLDLTELFSEIKRCLHTVDL